MSDTGADARRRGLQAHEGAQTGPADLEAKGAGGPRARGPYRKTVDTRESILDAALEVFGESGFHSGSLRDVARRVGMSNAGVLHHFADKTALLEAMLQRRDQADTANLRRIRGEARTVLTALVQLAASNTLKREIVKLYSILSTEATAADHPAHGHFVDRYSRTRSFVQDAFESLSEQGRLNPGVTPRSAAIGTLALMDGLQVQWLLDPTAVDMSAELATYLQTVAEVDLPAE